MKMMINTQSSAAQETSATLAKCDRHGGWFMQRKLVSNHTININYDTKCGNHMSSNNKAAFPDLIPIHCSEWMALAQLQVWSF